MGGVWLWVDARSPPGEGTHAEELDRAGSRARDPGAGILFKIFTFKKMQLGRGAWLCLIWVSRITTGPPAKPFRPPSPAFSPQPRRFCKLVRETNKEGCLPVTLFPPKGSWGGEPPEEHRGPFRSSPPAQPGVTPRGSPRRSPGAT